MREDGREPVDNKARRPLGPQRTALQSSPRAVRVIRDGLAHLPDIDPDETADAKSFDRC